MKRRKAQKDPESSICSYIVAGRFHQNGKQLEDMVVGPYTPKTIGLIVMIMTIH